MNTYNKIISNTFKFRYKTIFKIIYDYGADPTGIDTLFINYFTDLKKDFI